MDIILGIIVGLLVLAFLVTIHEGGHALAALKNKVVVEEFAIGFPPTAWKKKLKNGLLFKLNWLPLGGYVKLQGEHDCDNKKGDYGNATMWQKTQILFAGVAMNFIFACLVFTILAWTGLPKVINNQFHIKSDTKIVRSKVIVAQTVKNSPADKKGIKFNDKIISIAGKKIDKPSQVKKLTSSNAGKEVSINILRDGKNINKKIKLNNKKIAKKEGYLGVLPMQKENIKTTWSAPIVGVGTALQFSKVTLQGVGKLFVQFFSGLFQRLNFFNNESQKIGAKKLSSAGEMTAGPVGILAVMFPALLKSDVTEFFFFIAIISLTLAIMNILPIPALDGGRWFVTILFKIFKKPLGKKLEEKIHGYGMLFLLGLTFIITISDIGKFF